MKKLSFIVMLACLGLFTASCSDDKDDVKPADLDHAMEIKGTYNGDLVVELPAAEGEEAGKIESKDAVVIEYASKNKVNLVLEDFEITIAEGAAINVGTIKLEDVEVAEDKKTIVIKEKEFVDFPLDSEDLKDAKVTITVKGGIVNGSKLEGLAINIDKALEGTIKVTFDGERKANTEATISDVKVEKHAALEDEAKFDAEKATISVELKEGKKLTDLKEVVFTFETAHKATATPKSGSKIDLTSGASKIEVVAEDGTTKKEYTISVVEKEKEEEKK